MAVHYEADVAGWNLADKQVKKFYEVGPAGLLLDCRRQQGD